MAETATSGNEGLSRRSVGVRAKRSKAITFGALEAELLRSFPLDAGESWDRSGLLVGDRDEVIRSIAVALDPTPGAVRRAAESGANLLLTHHPAFLKPPARFTADVAEAGLAGAVVYEAARSGVGLMNFHTCLDSSAQAASVLPSLLSLHFTERLVQPLADHPGCGYGAICTPEEGDALKSLEQLSARCTSVFGRPPRVWGSPRQSVSTIAVCGGSAGFLMDGCVAEGVDVLICGEMRYHDALAASASGLAIIELGHDVSETPLTLVLTQAAIEAGVSRDTIVAIDQSGHWSYPDAVRL